MKERRKYPRYPSLHLVSYSHYGKDSEVDTQGVGRTLDLSKSGIKLQMEESFPLDTLLEITVAVNDKIVTFRGKIVFIAPLKENLHEVGIEITSVSEEDILILQDYLENISAKS